MLSAFGGLNIDNKSKLMHYKLPKYFNESCWFDSKKHLFFKILLGCMQSHCQGSTLRLAPGQLLKVRASKFTLWVAPRG